MSTKPNPDNTVPFGPQAGKAEGTGSSVPADDFEEIDKTVPYTAPTKSKEEIEKIVRTGKILTHFQLEKKLGEGGMGTVYLGTDVTLDRPVAIKFMNHTVIRNSLRANPNVSDKELSSTVEAMEGRFIREAKSAASINHPHLAQIYEANFDTDDWYIAMEFIKGDSLAQLLKKDRTFSIGQVLNIFKQTVEGLKHAWENYKIVHRDIKPANIMVTPEGVVKIVDLGLAKPVGGPQDMPDVTGGGMPIGTPQYMAPEQARGDDAIDFRADVFSLGATIYELCANQKAFAGNSAAQIYHCQVKREYKDLHELRPEIPKTLAKLIESMLDPKVGNRPTDYDDLLTRIKQVETDTSSSITTLVGLVTKEVRRLQSVDFGRLFPVSPLKDAGFWRRPLVLVPLVIAGLSLILLKTPPRLERVSWLWGLASALLWGLFIHSRITPGDRLRKGVLRAIGVTAMAAVPIGIVLGRLPFSENLFVRDYFSGNGPSLWKLILITGIVESVLRCIGPWLLPRLINKTPKSTDYCVVGLFCGLAFSFKSALLYSIFRWDYVFNMSTSLSRLALFLVLTPLLHACWGGISARFLALARESNKLQVPPMILGLVLSAVLQGLWLWRPCSYWSVVVGLISTLFFFILFTEEEASLPIPEEGE